MDSRSSGHDSSSTTTAPFEDKDTATSKPPQQLPVNPSNPSWLTKLIGLMWPNITDAVEKMAREMLPDMLTQNKPTWMTKLELETFELGDVSPQVEDVKAEPGTNPGAADVFLEFDFTWHGQQNIALLINPAPKFSQKVPLLGKMIGKAMTWRVGVRDLVVKGRLRTTFIPMLSQMPIVGAVQAAFVGLPHVDFQLTLPEGISGSAPMQYLDGWIDSFIADNILSMYMLPDHFFSQIDQNAKDIQTPEGILEVQVLEATNVPSMDWIGSSDPFVKLWLRPQAAKSSPVKSGAKPKWEEGEAHWALPVHLRSLQLLTVALFDSDSLGEDEVGRTRVPLDELAAGQVQDAWLDISIPSQGSTPAKEKRGARDKLAGALFGAKGSSPKDVAGCQVHVKLTFHELRPETVKQMNEVQMQGKSVSHDLIHDPNIVNIINKFDLADELFPTKTSNEGTA